MIGLVKTGAKKKWVSGPCGKFIDGLFTVMACVPDGDRWLCDKISDDLTETSDRWMSEC